MIAEPSLKLVILLGVLTLLGVVMGYCLALLVTRRKVQSAINAERDRLQQEGANRLDMQTAQESITSHRTLDKVSTSASAVAQAQANRIRTLEAQLRELQMARKDSGIHTVTPTPPTLLRRSNGRQSVRGIQAVKSADNVQALSQDLIIPTLAESEVSDSKEELELDLSDKNDGRATPRG